MKYDLSILIPSRNEEFLARTIQNILENIEGNTEIIAVLDGQWADPPVPDHERVTLVYSPEVIGHRAATNAAAKISKAKYLMKVDAHCAFDKGFDVKMMKEMHDDWTIVPNMRNLHVFDWVCKACNWRQYQGPTPEKCPRCGGGVERDMIWKPKAGPNSSSYCFDNTFHFQYFGEFKKRPEGKGNITETMSLQGSCFMCTRDKYFELELCDEKWGIWGQQGVEVACKTWLSGGRVMCNKKTWYAHMFRTQGGDFGFPYPLAGTSWVRQFSRDIFFNNKWEKQIYPLSWLVERFWPVHGWKEEDLQKQKEREREWKPKNKLTKGIVYYTDNQLNIKIAHACQKQLKKIGLPIISASLKPMVFGDKNIHLPFTRGPLTMFKQILAGLEASEADIIFFAEHDILYHHSHFDFIPPKKDVFYYNLNVWKVDWKTGKALKVDKCEQLSGMCVYRELAINYCQEKIKQIEERSFDRHYEPRGKRGHWNSREPIVDIRHEGTLTPNRWSKDQFRNQENTKGWTEGKCPEWAKDFF